jgi:hypothetical protein
MELKHAADREAARLYARCLGIGSALAFALIAAELAAYVTGLVSPYVPLQRLPALWGLPMTEFLAAAQVPSGWGWLALIGQGDYLNFIGIALLAAVAGFAYLCALLRYAARRDGIYALLAAAQLLVLIAAASGLLNSFAGG